MKTTMWTELQANECRVVGVDERAGIIMSVQIKHVLLPRALKGRLDGLVGAPRAYPELAKR